MTATTITLLVVHPDPSAVRQVAAILGAAGARYRVRHASSQREFMEALGKHPPDVVLADEHGVPGLTLLQILGEAQTSNEGVPVVVLSGRARESQAIRLLRKGAADYLRSEYLDRLPSMIERVLREHESTIQRRELQKEVERAAGLIRENQRLATLGRQASSIAHEINNPLEAISNLLFLADNEPGLPSSAQKFLKMAQSELERVVAISKQTLNFYREAPAPLSVRLSALLDEVLVLYRHLIAEKQIEVVREFGAEDSVVILPGEMRQVFSNLIVNAIEADPSGGKLRLRVRRSRCWSDMGIWGVRVTIADTGAGMLPDVRRRIGSPFFTTKGQHGTGLGLWVSKSILSRYGGSLLVRTSTGSHHGTAFTAFLPTNLRPRAVGQRTLAPPRGRERSEDRCHQMGSRKTSVLKGA